jgi:hypothetical protein
MTLFLELIAAIGCFVVYFFGDEVLADLRRRRSGPERHAAMRSASPWTEERLDVRRF